MTEGRKRPTTPTTNAPNAKKPVRRPAITATKATQARAKAIQSQLSTKPNVIRKKKPTAEDPNTLVKSYHTTASELKQRPAWDLRGKVSDMTELYKLNLERLEDLRKFKRELEILNDEKESQEKDALQQAAALRTELLNLERNHATDITDLQTNQRIEYQKLVDESLIYTRKLQSQDIELNDAKSRLDSSLNQLSQIKSENQILRESIEKTSIATQEAEAEIKTLKVKAEKMDMSITDREKEIEDKKKAIETINISVNALEEKLADSHAVRDRLLKTVKDLEENSTHKRAVTKLGA